ncbi:MAG: hypothetical protein J6W85_08835 [Lachnospiraceae bacterium]|nr:hypothetical protein [Lachnospiraceae bacterium]
MRKDNNKKNEAVKVKFGIFVSALITAAGVFAVMTYLQRQALSDFEKKEVYVAASVIPKGTVIDESNAGEYLALKSVDAGCIPDHASFDPKLTAGLSPVYDISGGTILTDSMFTYPDTVTSEMEEPVMAGFKADDLSKAVSGILRAGDRIDICYVDPETGKGELLCENVYVVSGYDAYGNAISDAGPAVMFNIYLESRDAPVFYEALASGSLYVVRRCG